MSGEWIKDYLDSTEEIRANYRKNREEFGWNVDIAATVRLNNKRYSIFLFKDELRIFVGAPLTWKLIDGEIPKWDRRIIHISDIQYFSREGDVYTETKISGGGSTGLNIGGAIIGGIVAGPVGAIIGGQSEAQPIKSETIRHDERKTVLVHNKGKLEFAPEDYAVLMKLIPEKELSAIQQKKALETHQDKQSSPEGKLRKLQALHNDGLLTDEEFEEKRKKLIEEL